MSAVFAPSPAAASAPKVDSAPSTLTLSGLAACDGTRLALRRWPEPEGTTRANLLIVHGLGEHSGRYEHVGRRLRDAGLRVFAYDHRGHGQSEGGRGRLARPDDLLTDLACVLDALRAEHGGPWVLLGHSMGGLVTARFVAEGLRPVDGLVLSSPALDSGLSVFTRALLTVAHVLARNLPMGNGLDPTGVSRDAAVVAAYRADPLVHDRVTARLVRFIVDGGAYVLQRAAGWRVPTLLLWAGCDRLVRPAGSEAFARRAPAAQVQARCFPEMFHELLNEPDQAAVFEAVESWLDTRFPR
ncbi:lysophospholipase [Aquabacterium sp. A7-Y]|uniref:alpha/beta hydrolase n=1 Tax=Aquabacterium sp. A7-Y TaxID=1349605 RepID=UPI00223E6F49|nr:alpha/beta hydrolase [Aquabacterium sp. A7-Y]MCW7538839.1 lysophospholipase [Aquabacterium sp. A7-Y]